jgi:hypothetical protein
LVRGRSWERRFSGWGRGVGADSKICLRRSGQHVRRNGQGDLLSPVVSLTLPRGRTPIGCHRIWPKTRPSPARPHPTGASPRARRSGSERRQSIIDSPRSTTRKRRRAHGGRHREESRKGRGVSEAGYESTGCG